MGKGEIMAIELYTESLTLEQMGCKIGENEFGFVFPQGDVPTNYRIHNLLLKAGGKPKHCEITDFSKGGNGKAKPEYIITFNEDSETIIVVECKRYVNRHESNDYNNPKDFAVDGVLYYAKYLKESYNVIAVAISGTSKDKIKVSTFQWLKGQDQFLELKKGRDVVLEVGNYLNLLRGKKIERKFSLQDIRNTALLMHNTLREIKVTERNKPIFIAGILIALNDEDFANHYHELKSFNLVMASLMDSIKKVLDASDIKKDKIDNIKNAFQILKTNTKLKEKPLGEIGSITWYIELLDNQIKPMMIHAENTLDALGVFYHEFVKYSGGDGSGLGIVLTPQHLTEFMCELAEVNKQSRVVDICCGSGSFLVTAMSKMFQDANQQELENIRKNCLYGVELDPELFTLAIANMIIRKDGKSNINHGDCFDKNITREIKSKNCNIGLMNPPYSQKDYVELEFVEHLLDILVVGGKACVVVPMSCAIGTKFKDIRERLFKKHTLKAVFSMPNDIFYPTGTNVCVMLWEAHKKHNSSIPTFFAYCKDDGFVKRKKLGRVDALNKWEDIKNEWLKLYRSLSVVDGLSALKGVSHSDEWLCEAYMKTDYSKLTQEDFEITIRKFLAYKIENGDLNE